MRLIPPGVDAPPISFAHASDEDAGAHSCSRAVARRPRPAHRRAHRGAASGRARSGPTPSLGWRRSRPGVPRGRMVESHSVAYPLPFQALRHSPSNEEGRRELPSGRWRTRPSLSRAGGRLESSSLSISGRRTGAVSKRHASVTCATAGFAPSITSHRSPVGRDRGPRGQSAGPGAPSSACSSGNGGRMCEPPTNSRNAVDMPAAETAAEARQRWENRQVVTTVPLQLSLGLRPPVPTADQQGRPLPSRERSAGACRPCWAGGGTAAGVSWPSSGPRRASGMQQGAALYRWTPALARTQARR